MEIRDIQIIRKDSDTVECEVYVGNVSKDALEEARVVTGYTKPKLYINGIYDKNKKTFEVKRITEDHTLYTRGSTGKIIPLNHIVQAKSIINMQILVSHNMENRKL